MKTVKMSVDLYRRLNSCTTRDTTRYAIDGIHVNRNGVAAATDGRIIAFADVQCDGDSADTIPFGALARLKCDPMDVIEFDFDSDSENVVAKVKGARSETARCRRPFPPGVTVIPKIDKDWAVVYLNPALLAQLAAVCVDDDSQGVAMLINPNPAGPSVVVSAECDRKAIGVIMPKAQGNNFREWSVGVVNEFMRKLGVATVNPKPKPKKKSKRKQA